MLAMRQLPLAEAQRRCARFVSPHPCVQSSLILQNIFIENEVHLCA